MEVVMNSPCTKVCKIKEGICTGCHRTLEQIGAWGSMTDKERQEAMRELKWPVAVVDRVGIMQRLSPNTNLPEGTKLYTHPASAEVERLRSRVAELVAVAVSVRDDLLLRSEIDSDGTRCVNLSASKWSSFCDVIDEAAKAEGADNAG